MIAFLLGLTLATTAAPVPEACPAPVMTAPHYPAAMMLSNTSGTTLVSARFDDCGRIVEASVEQGSGHASLDAAALETVRGWVLSPAQRAQVGGGPWVKLPVKFGGVQTVTAREPAWPKSHRRPRYLADDTALGFDTIAALRAADRWKPDVLRTPYSSVRKGMTPVVMTSFHEDREDPRTFWLAYIVHRQGRSMAENTIAMARYRLLEESGQPVVRVAMVCEASEAECEKLNRFLLEGLPTAKPPRT